jgi:hypothetical protein
MTWFTNRFAHCKSIVDARIPSDLGAIRQGESLSYNSRICCFSYHMLD